MQIMLNDAVFIRAEAMLTGCHGRQPRNFAYLNEYNFHG